MSRLTGRIERLERNAVSHDPDQVFLMWCRPDEDEIETLNAAAANGVFAANGQFGWCIPWKGAGPMPAPRWTTLKQLTDDELETLIASVRARTSPEEWAEAEQAVEEWHRSKSCSARP